MSQDSESLARRVPSAIERPTAIADRVKMQVWSDETNRRLREAGWTRERLVALIMDALSCEPGPAMGAAGKMLDHLKDPIANPAIITFIRAHHGDRVHSFLSRTVAENADDEVMSTFIRDAQSDDVSLRRRAMDILGMIGDRSTTSVLLNALNDHDHWVRALAAYGLRRIGDPTTMGPLMDALSDPTQPVRVGALEALMEMVSRETDISPFLSLLADANRSVRSSAVDVLGVIGNPAATESLIDLLADEEKTVRGRAAWALGAIGDPRIVEPFLRVIDAEDGVAAAYAAQHLASLGDTSVAPHLIRMLGCRDRHLQRVAGEALITLFGATDEGVLATALADAHRGLRIAAISALAEAGERGIPLLRSALDDEDEDVRMEAARALIDIDGPASTAALIAALRDDDADVRGSAASGLGVVWDPEAQEPLIQILLNDEDSHARSDAALALASGRGPTVVEALLRGLEDEDSDVRGSCALALSESGDARTVDALLQFLTDNPLVEKGPIALAQVCPPSDAGRIINLLSGPADVGRAAAFALLLMTK